MYLLAFGSYDTRSHPRVGVLIEGLAAHGWQIREVNAPLGLDTATRVGLLHQPWRLPLLAGRLARVWTTLAYRAGQAGASGTGPNAVLVGYLGHFDVLLARRLFPHTPIVLDHLIFAADTAADRGVRGPGLRARVTQALLRRLDAAAIAAADLVVVDTDEHAAMVESVAGRTAAERTVVVPVGAPCAWFAAGDRARQTLADRELEGRGSGTTPEALSVVFFGLYTPLQGAPVIGEAIGLLAQDGAARHPITFTMIGTGQDRRATEVAAADNPAVTWIDWVDAARLPAFVAAHDVCLGIVGTTAKARRVVPNKVFQAAAAGCVVLTGDTDAQRRALADAAVFVPAGDAAALAEALRVLAGDRAGVGRARRAARRRAEEIFTPAAVTQPLATALERLSPPPIASNRPAAFATTTRHPQTTVVDRPRDGQDRGVTPASPSADPPLAPRALLRWDVVERLVVDLAPRTVLEMGCGQGSFGARLTQLSSTYVGVEPDAAAATVATERISPRGGTVLLGDQRLVPPGSQYDVVCAFEVLEHLEDDEAMLEVWAGFVRPGGHLLLSVPAWPQRFGPMDLHAGHYRRYTPDHLESLLYRRGLEAVDITVYGWPLGYALEAVRNPVDARKLARDCAPASMAERTASTGRTFQPRRALAGRAIAAGTLPFRYLQRLAPTRGTGLVALARKPQA